MSKNYFFKSIDESSYGKKLKRYFELVPKWNEVINRVGTILNEDITKIARDPEDLYIDIDELQGDTKNLFTKEGRLKKNLNEAKEMKEIYLEIIEDVGLSEYVDLYLINFFHGIIRTNDQQRIESFISSDGVNYIKANYNLLDRDKSSGSIEPISEIEFEETYLKELKRSKENKCESHR